MMSSLTAVTLLFTFAAQAYADSAAVLDLPHQLHAQLPALDAHLNGALDAHLNGLKPLPGLEHVAQKPLHAAEQAWEQAPAADAKPFTLPAQTETRMMKPSDTELSEKVAQRMAAKLEAMAEKHALAHEQLAQATGSSSKVKKFPGLKEAMKQKAKKVEEAFAKDANTGMKEIPKLAEEMKTAGEDMDVKTAYNRLFTAIAREVVKRHHEFNAANLAIVGWSFAKMGRNDADLFDALKKESMKKLDDFNVQDITYLTWAFTIAGRKEPELFGEFARRIEKRLEQFKATDLATTLWSYAHQEYKDPQLYAAFGRAVQWRSAEFNTQELETLVKSFTVANFKDEATLSALTKAAETAWTKKAEEWGVDTSVDWIPCDNGLPTGCKAVCSIKKGEEKKCPELKDGKVDSLPNSCQAICGLDKPAEKEK